jgi:hypothetical protein
MSISPEKVTYRVRVVPAATTAVDFVVNREYGLGGRVTSSDGKGAPNIRVEVRDASGTPVQTTLTDGYGYYQFSGLPPDEYRVRIRSTDESDKEPTASIDVVISDAFVFDADLTLAGTAEAAPAVTR